VGPRWSDDGLIAQGFLFFGAVPLHPHTVIELLFDPTLGERFVAIEILVNYIQLSSSPLRHQMPPPRPLRCMIGP